MHILAAINIVGLAGHKIARVRGQEPHRSDQIVRLLRDAFLSIVGTYFFNYVGANFSDCFGKIFDLFFTDAICCNVTDVSDIGY
jgi:hypothetical protein